VPTVAEALAAARRAGAPIVVGYLLVDRARRRRFRATVEALRDGGLAALELGFPFSDPIADGPVLASAHDRALRNGTTWSDLLAACRIASARLPVAVMTYANPLWHGGLDRRAAALARAGASGLIVPDLSLEESAPFARAARRHGLSLVELAAPGAAPARVAAIARASRGFVYLVGHYGTTGGAEQGATVDLRPLVAAAHRGGPGPVLVGFGVRDAASATAARRSGADGVVVGTALEERLARGERPPALARFVRELVRGVAAGA